MLRVLGEIIIPLLIAFALGWLVMGWLTWRWRRTKVTTTEWQSVHDRSATAEARSAKLTTERDDLDVRVNSLAGGNLNINGVISGNTTGFDDNIQSFNGTINLNNANTYLGRTETIDCF